ncbi:MAG: hypothetical protein WBV94_05100 [Blastocatellia bacterium]
MPNPYATAAIAGVDQQTNGEDLRASLIGGADLLSARAINNRPAASGTSLYTQTAPLTAGIPFAVKLDFDDIDLLKSTVTAIKAAIDSQASFNVTLEDDLHDISTNAVPDGSKWLQYPDRKFTSNQVKSVVMKFLTA